MNEFDWVCTVSDDRRSAEVSMPQPDGSSAIFSFDGVDELQRLINTLGAMRSQMQPAVPQDASESGAFVDRSPIMWALPSRTVEGRRPLLIRHAAFGWLGFDFDEHGAAALAAALTDRG